MSQDHYLLTEMDVDRIKGLSESFHLALIEFIDSRKLKIPPWEEGDYPEEREFSQFATDLLDEADKREKRQLDFPF